MSHSEAQKHPKPPTRKAVRMRSLSAPDRLSMPAARRVEPHQVREGFIGPVPIEPVTITMPRATRTTVPIPRFPATDEGRYALNKSDTASTLAQVYRAYYDELGDIRPVVDRSVYRILGYAESTYAQTPITPTQWFEFSSMKDADIVSQRVGQRKLQTNTQAAMRGDYFRVYNRRAVKGSGKGRARRIVVNVATQEAALKIAKALNGQFDQPVVGPNLGQFKIYLSANPSNPRKEFKHDKLVIYYNLADPKAPTDPVGDGIIRAIQGAVSEDEMGDGLAPFYSRVAPGVGWAEEPKDHSDAGLDRSFTTTRAAIIEDVINARPHIESQAKFNTLVYEALARKGVDPDHPHRHVPTKT